MSRYIYFAQGDTQQKEIYVKHICGYIIRNHGKFPMYKVDKSRRMIFNLDINYKRLLCPYTESLYRELIDIINEYMTNIMAHYRFVIYIHPDRQIIYSNDYGEYWRANIVAHPIHDIKVPDYTTLLNYIKSTDSFRFKKDLLEYVEMHQQEITPKTNIHTSA